MSDTTESQVVSRLAGTLESAFSAQAAYLRSVNTPGIGDAYPRLSRAIATGLIPYIDTKDLILDRKIGIEITRNNRHDQQLQVLEQQLRLVDSRIQSFSLQIQAVASQLTQVSTQVSTVGSQINQVSSRVSAVAGQVTQAQQAAQTASSIASDAGRRSGEASAQASLAQNTSTRALALASQAAQSATATNISVTTAQQRLQDQLRLLVTA